MAKTKRRALDEQAAFRYYNSGLSDQHIADNCGVCKETIRNWRKRMGLTVNIVCGQVQKKDKPTTPKKDDQITPLERDAIAARRAGMTYGQYKAKQYAAAHPWNGGRR